jgi:hypothetical protein
MPDTPFWRARIEIASEHLVAQSGGSVRVAEALF